MKETTGIKNKTDKEAEGDEYLGRKEKSERMQEINNARRLERKK